MGPTYREINGALVMPVTPERFPQGYLYKIELTEYILILIYPLIRAFYQFIH